MPQDAEMQDPLARAADATREKRDAELPGGPNDRSAFFDQAPISIWVEDWSALKPEVERLREEGVRDFGRYFREHRALVFELTHRIALMDFNAAAVETYRAPSKEALRSMGGLYDLLNTDEFAMACDALAAFAEGKERCVVEGWEKTYDGGLIYIRDTVFVPAEFRENWSRVMHAVEDITERKQAEEKLREAQELRALGQLTGGIAHDFNNLLAVILGRLQMIEQESDEGSRIREHARLGIDSSLKGEELTRRLLAFARRQPLAPGVVDLSRCLAGLSEMLERTLPETIEIRTSLAPGVGKPIVDPNQLDIALLNLALNARDAMPAGGRLEIGAENIVVGESGGSETVPAPGEYVALTVSDNGAGIAEENLPRVFEPFFTTKALGEGSGLGLSMVYGFAKQSGGGIAIDSAPGEGTTVTLYLPKGEEKEVPLAKRPEKGEPKGKGEVVLLVEDDSTVRAVAVDTLKARGYRVLVAQDGLAAVAFLKSADRIDLLFTDVVLPGGMTGPDLAVEAEGLIPGVKVLFTSGYVEEAVERRGRFKQGMELLLKPYRMEDLARKVRQALDA